MELTRHSFADYPFRWPPHARRDIYSRGAPPMGFTPENRFGAGGRPGVLLVSTSSGPCGSAHVWLGVSFALVGVWAGGIVRIRVWISRQGARFVRIGKFGKRNHRVFRHSAKNVHSTGFHLDSKLEWYSQRILFGKEISCLRRTLSAAMRRYETFRYSHRIRADCPPDI